MDVKGHEGSAVYTVTVNKNIGTTEFVYGLELPTPEDGNANEQTGTTSTPLIIGQAEGNVDGTGSIILKPGKKITLAPLTEGKFLPAVGTRFDADWKVVSDDDDATAPISKALYENLKISAEVTKASDETGANGEITITVVPVANTADNKTCIELEGDALTNGIKGTLFLSYQGIKIPVVVAVTKPADGPSANSNAATISFKAGTADQKTNVTPTSDAGTKVVNFSWTLDGVELELDGDGTLDLSALNLEAGVYTFKYNEWYVEDGLKSKVTANDVKVVVFPDAIDLSKTTFTGTTEQTVNVTGVPSSMTITAAGDNTTVPSTINVNGSTLTFTPKQAGGNTGTITVTLAAEGKSQAYDAIEVTVND